MEKERSRRGSLEELEQKEKNKIRRLHLSERSPGISKENCNACEKGDRYIDVRRIPKVKRETKKNGRVTTAEGIGSSLSFMKFFISTILQKLVPTRREIMLDIFHECLLRRWSIYYRL